MNTINQNLQNSIKKLLRIKKNKNLVDNEYQVLLYLIDTAIWTTKKTIADKNVAKIKSNRLDSLKLIYSDVNKILSKNKKNKQIKQIFDNLKDYGYIRYENRKSYYSVDIHKLLIDLDYYDLLKKNAVIIVYNEKYGLIKLRCCDIIKAERLKNWHRKLKND